MLRRTLSFAAFKVRCRARFVGGPCGIKIGEELRLNSGLVSQECLDQCGARPTKVSNDLRFEARGELVVVLTQWRFGEQKCSGVDAVRRSGGHKASFSCREDGPLNLAEQVGQGLCSQRVFNAPFATHVGDHLEGRKRL